MSVCVLDSLFTVQWIFRDEASPDGDAALKVIDAGGVTVPALWFVEVTNTLDMAERRGRISQAGVRDALVFLQSLSLDVDEPASLPWSGPVLDLMHAHRLTAYDATYLELAMRRELSLATKDRELIVVAPAVDVRLFNGAR